MCKCNHKSRKDEASCCCNCHGKSNAKKSCNTQSKNTDIKDETNSDQRNSYEKRV